MVYLLDDSGKVVYPWCVCWMVVVPEVSLLVV